jgi:hypothetical protein
MEQDSRKLLELTEQIDQLLAEASEARERAKFSHIRRLC